MTGQPTLETARLRLRPFSDDDAPAVERLASDKAIAATTLTIPHPYPEGAAAEWIGKHAELFREGRGAEFAIVRRDEDAVIGATGLYITRDHRRAELGYWIARHLWSQGYATEAARAMIDYGFRGLELNRIHAHHVSGNAASGRVMEKIGMRYEGELRQHILKWGRFEDIRAYAILRSEYDA